MENRDFINCIPCHVHPDWWENLSEEEESTMEMGLQQLEEGNIVPLEEVQKSILNSDLNT